MTIFKGYMLMFRRNISSAIMYFVIFISMAILMTMVSEKDNTKDFAAAKVDVAVVDLDNSELSKNLVNYLKEKHEVDVMEDDKAALYENLYYGAKSVVLRIQEGFEKKAFDDEVGVHLTNAPGSYRGIYLEQQINLYVNNVVSYCEAGYSVDEACKKVEAKKESKVLIEDVNGNGGEVPGYAFFFQFIPYLFVSVLGSVLAKILFEFRRKNVKNRAMASSVSLLRQNGEAILAFLAIGTGIYLLTAGIAVVLYGKEFISSSNLVWYLLNMFTNMLVALVIAFLIGLFVKNGMQVSSITVPVGLALSFICGVFVPLNILGSQITNIAKFLPIYWYEVVNDLLTNYADISGELQAQVLSGIGIQLLFVLALGGIGVAIAKYQQQER